MDPTQQNQQTPSVPFGLFNNLLGGGGDAGGMGGMGSFFGPGMFAALIGLGKNTEAQQPNSPVGQGLLAGLGPSLSQIFKDPVGMGLPTAFGLPFLTPFTSSKASQATKPEWSGIFPTAL